MTRYMTRHRVAIVAALAAPLAAAAIGNRAAGALAALGAAAWFDFFFAVPYLRFTIRSSADVTLADLAGRALGSATSSRA